MVHLNLPCLLVIIAEHIIIISVVQRTHTAAQDNHSCLCTDPGKINSCFQWSEILYNKYIVHKCILSTEILYTILHFIKLLVPCSLTVKGGNDGRETSN